MYHIYLQHQVHGSKVAISEMEAESDEANGWVRYNPNSPYESAGEDQEPSGNMLVKRRGRPPKQG